MSLPLVSIIIPCYNAEKYVAEAIQSALDQTYSNCEVIVIDDGSSDGSLEIIKSFGAKIKWETGSNRGGCAARNRGIDISKGTFLKFLDADDLLGKDLVEVQAERLSRDQNSAVYGPWSFLVFEQEKWIEKPTHLVPDQEGDLLDQWLCGVYIVPHAFLWPRGLIEAIGKWDEELHADQDGDLFYRAYLQGTRFYSVTTGQAYYRKDSVHSASSVSERKCGHALASRIRSLEKLLNELISRGDAERYFRSIGFSYWNIARAYATTGLPHVRDCEAKGKKFYSGIPGTLTHRALVTIFGIETKEKLSVVVRRIFLRK